MFLRVLVILNLIFFPIILTLPVDSVKSSNDSSLPSSTALISTEATTTPTTSLPEITTPRRVVSYDQRQEGKYNIRADLENFVILVVPSNPSSGLNLLDLLTKSALKKNHAKHAHHKKATEIKASNEEDSVKIKPVVHNQVIENHPVEQFVEGRTPYRVDISSIDTAISSIEAHNLEIMQPPYLPQEIGIGRAGSNSYKPIIFEVEPSETVIPAKVSVTVLRRDDVSSDDDRGGVGKQIYRKTKSLSNLYGDDEFNNFNSVLLTTSDNDDGLSINTFDDSFDSLNIGNLDTLDMDTQNKQQYPELQQDQQQYQDGWDLKLIGASEQCGPDRRRDSYGVCQFVKLDLD